MHLDTFSGYPKGFELSPSNFRLSKLLLAVFLLRSYQNCRLFLKIPTFDKLLSLAKLFTNIAIIIIKPICYYDTKCYNISSMQMRKVSKNIESFDVIQQSPLKRSAPLTRQPLIQYQKTERQAKKQLCYGLKDLSVDYESKFNANNETVFGDLFPIINPQSTALLIWNLLIEMAVLFNFFMAPLVATYTYQAYIFDMKTPLGITLNGVSVALLYLDILVRFHVCFYKREKLISDRALIFHRYFRFQFWIDLISVICITIYMAADSYELCYVRLAVYLRFPTLNDIDESILHNLNLHKGFILFYRLIRMVIIIWLLTTWAACIFFTIDYNFYLDPNNQYTQLSQLWLTDSQAVNNLDIIVSFPQWQIWYLYSLYWSIQTSCTTGYGDLTPRNPPQIIYCNFVMLLMTVLFAYFINEVWSIIQQVQQEWESNENWHQLRLYLKEVELPSSHKQKISSYMREVFEDEQQKQIQNFISENVSQEVKDQFYYELRRYFYEFTAFSFLKGCSNEKRLIYSLVYALQEYRQGQDQIIYAIGQSDFALYYVRSGSVKLENQFSNIGQQAQRNQFFGLFQFLTMTVRNHSAIAETFVRMWRLQQKKLKDSIRNQQQAYVIIYQCVVKISNYTRKAEIVQKQQRNWWQKVLEMQQPPSFHSLMFISMLARNQGFSNPRKLLEHIIIGKYQNWISEKPDEIVKVKAKTQTLDTYFDRITSSLLLVPSLFQY